MRLPVLIALAGLLILAACGEPASDRAFGERVRAYLLENPEVLQEASNALAEKQARKANAQARAAIKANRDALERDNRDMVVNPDGKVTVVEFFDYDCSYCKLVAPQVIAYAKAHPDVRFVFKDLTIFGEPSRYAAAGAQLVRDQDRYMTVHRALMAQRPLNTDPLVTAVLNANGVNSVAAKMRQASPAAKSYLADVRALADKLGLQGTPAFIVGDTLVAGADWAAVQAAIEAST